MQRLVQHSFHVAAQHGKSQRLAAEEVAARVRVLLAAGLTKADVAMVITAVKGGPYCNSKQLEETVGFIRRELCSSSEQLATILRRAPYLLCWLPKVLERQLAWWREQALNAKQWSAIRNRLRQRPSVLCYGSGTAR